MVSNPLLFEMFDLSSITTIVSGSAPLDKSLVDRVHALQPKWRILGAYGMEQPQPVSFCSTLFARLCLVPRAEILLTPHRLDRERSRGDLHGRR